MKLRAVFNDLMKQYHRQGVLLGQTTASSPEEYFGFDPGQVTGIHFHKRGVGEGVWFRLHCGRVIDEVAKACRCASEPSLYDPGAH